MKTIKDILEEFDKKSREYKRDDGFISTVFYIKDYRCNDYDIDSIRDLFIKSLNRILDEMPTGLAEENEAVPPAGAYWYDTAKEELQEHIKNLKG